LSVRREDEQLNILVFETGSGESMWRPTARGTLKQPKITSLTLSHYGILKTETLSSIHETRVRDAKSKNSSSGREGTFPHPRSGSANE